MSSVFLLKPQDTLARSELNEWCVSLPFFIHITVNHCASLSLLFRELPPNHDKKEKQRRNVKVTTKKKTAIWFAGLPTWQLGLAGRLSSFLADKYPNPSKTSKPNQLRWDKERLDNAAPPPAWKKSTCFCSRRGVHISNFLSEVTNPLIFLFECNVAAD